MMNTFWCRQCGKTSHKESRRQRLCQDCKEKNKQFYGAMRVEWQNFKQERMEKRMMSV
jgi:Zn finger protein HypA/HybF involved in hydrogenase expression